MRTSAQHRKSKAQGADASRRTLDFGLWTLDSRSAFTLPEIVMAMGLLVLLLGGAVASHVFGALLLEKNSSKASASAEARQNITTLTAEISSSKNVLVGTGTATSFSEPGFDVPQQGNAVQIYPSSDTNAFILYFLDTTAKSL